MKQKEVKGWDYLSLSLLAFGGLGLEVLLAFVIEPMIFKAQMQDWSTAQCIIHWIVTCIVWAIMVFLLERDSKKNYAFSIFQESKKPHMWQWIAIAVCVIVSLIISYSDWDGFKVVKEFQNKGWLKFIFQYIYYVFETALVMLIIVFGQKAGEKWFKNPNVPYGSIVVALTWGLVHTLTKGDLRAGISCAVSGLLYGLVYLLANRNVKIVFPILVIMFVL